MGYYEAIRETDRGERDEDDTVAVQSDTQRQDQERTHPRDYMSDTCFEKQKITERTIELVWGMGM